MSCTPCYLILVLTDECNLKCVYCYRGNYNNEVKVMPREMIEASIHNIASSDKRCHVQLTGGEPTIVPHLIEHAAKTLRKLKPDATLGVQTNATLLDRSIVKIFKTYNIQVGVSLDGPMDIQEQLRGQAKSTLKGLKLLETEQLLFRVTSVVTNQNIEYLDKLILMLGAFSNARGVGLDMLIKKGRARLSDHVDLPNYAQIKQGLNLMLDALRLVNNRSLGKLQLRELETVKKAFTHKHHPYFCHAGANESLAVCPDGSLFPCSQTIGDDKFYMGNIDDLKPHTQLDLKQFKLLSQNCVYCPLSKHCPGDCYSRQYYNSREDQHLICLIYQLLYKQLTLDRQLGGKYTHLAKKEYQRLSYERQGEL